MANSSVQSEAKSAPRPPLPPFTKETAIQKVSVYLLGLVFMLTLYQVQAAEDAWNSRDPERVSLLTPKILCGEIETSFLAEEKQSKNF
jgi:nuclear transport factor 2 (NTF2) superfamily protein